MNDTKARPSDAPMDGEATMVTSLDEVYPNLKSPDALPKKAYLIVIAGNSVGEMYQIRKDDIRLGRDVPGVRTPPETAQRAGPSHPPARRVRPARGEVK